MASVRSIAKRTGVSIATVSRVLNGSTHVSGEVRDRVMEATAEMGYVPVVGKRSNDNIALLYTGRLTLNSPFDAALMAGMGWGLEQHGYDLLVMSGKSRSEGESWSQLFMRKGVVGAIIRTDEDTREECQEIAATGVPAVVVADEFADGRVLSMGIDSRKATGQAIEHLIHLGHKRIAVVLNVVDDHDHAQRFEAYRETMEQNDLRVNDRYVFRAPASTSGGEALLRQIVGMPNRPTAVFVMDPFTAVGLFNEAQKTGVSIPGDLSVIGFDDSQQRMSVFPRMSAVCQNAMELGGSAMAQLHRMIRGTGDGEVTRLECWLELHESTAAPARVSRR